MLLSIAMWVTIVSAIVAAFITLFCVIERVSPREVGWALEDALWWFVSAIQKIAWKPVNKS